MKALPSHHQYTPDLRVVKPREQTTALSDKQSAKQQALVIVARYVRKLRAENGGSSLAPAIEEFQMQFLKQLLPLVILNALALLRPKKQAACPDRSTMFRWDKKYGKHLNGDVTAAAPKHKGSERTVHGWEALALRIYSRPSKPTIAAVARELREDHQQETATDSNVRRYLKSIPKDKGELSPHRMGPRLQRNTQKGYVRRNTEMLPVGAIYQGDGHTIDVYLAHPFTGKIWRAELTVWLDVASRYVAGWYISESESSHSTLFALSHALMAHNHVPAMLHIDNGSGYASKLMSDESAGFYAKFDIDPMFALPYNAKAKGQVERFFGTMERDFGKQWPSYCGKDMADEMRNKIVIEVNRGNYQLPTLQDYKIALTLWIEKYHHREHRGLNGKTPAELWATLERTPLHIDDDAIFRPRVERVVQRGAVRLHNREYATTELYGYNTETVIVEYDLHADDTVRILNMGGRWLCDAPLVLKADYIPKSRLIEAQQKSLAGKEKRLEQKLEEVRDRSGLAITHADGLEDLEAANAAAGLLLEDKKAMGFFDETGVGVDAPTPNQRSDGDEIIIDTTVTDY